MESFEEYDIKIADYFDDKMNAEQEEAFIEEVGGNVHLRERYKEELAARAILGSEHEAEKKTAGGIVFPLNMGVSNAGQENKNSTLVVPLYRRGGSIAAAVILIVAGAATLMITMNKDGKPAAVAVTSVKKDTAKAVDTLNTLPPAPQNNSELAANPFSKLYKPYSGENDPVQLSELYDDYKAGKYNNVLKATKADVQEMGVDDKKEGLSQYLQLYKGLAYLAQGNAAPALKQFDSVMQAAGKQTQQYYAAQWYSALAALQLSQATRADSIAAEINTGGSPYKTKANEMVRLIAGKQGGR